MACALVLVRTTVDIAHEAELWPPVDGREPPGSSSAPHLNYPPRHTRSTHCLSGPSVSFGRRTTPPCPPSTPSVGAYEPMTISPFARPAPMAPLALSDITDRRYAGRCQPPDFCHLESARSRKVEPSCTQVSIFVRDLELPLRDGKNWPGSIHNVIHVPTLTVRAGRRTCVRQRPFFCGAPSASQKGLVH